MPSKGSLTRQRIIEKSVQLFSVKGYFHTSIDDIVKATGVTKGALYGHFRNKEEIWYAGYDECVKIWKGIVFQGVRGLSNPLERLERVIENSLKNYLGADVFEGGCFFLNSLVELAGQAPTMNDHVLKGFRAYTEMLRLWLAEAEQQGLLREGLNLPEVANFIVIAVEGASSMYAASKDPAVWQLTLAQLRAYLGYLKKD